MNDEMEEQETQTALPAVKGRSLFFDVAMFNHVQRVSQVFSASTMVPVQFQKNVPNCIIALNLADRMGVDPFMLMQNMYIVHGKPGIEAKLAIALINGCGRFEPLQYKHSDKDGGNCIAYAKDIKSGKTLESVPVSMQMAKDEGWSSKQGSKWKTMPKLMLEYRSAMFFARVYAPEVLLGLKTREELYDIIDMEPGRNGAYTTPEQKAADLTKKIKEKPDYTATDIKDTPAEELKTKLDEGDKEVEGYSNIKPDATESEVGIIPSGVTPIEWLTSCRPSTSPANAKAAIKVFEAQKVAIENLEDRKLMLKLQAKYLKTVAYLDAKENRKQEVAEEDPPVPDETSVESDSEPDEANGRLKFLAEMKKYKERNSDVYAEVLMNNDWTSMNAVKPGDEKIAIGFMKQAFFE